MDKKMKYMGAARSHTLFTDTVKTKIKEHLDDTPAQTLVALSRIDVCYRIDICAKDIELAFVQKFIEYVPSPNNVDVSWALSRMSHHIEGMKSGLNVQTLIPSAAERKEKIKIVLDRLVHRLGSRGADWTPSIADYWNPPKTLKEMKQDVFGLAD